MKTHIIVLLAFLGMIFGSFGSVLLLRLCKNINFSILRSIAFGRSECPHCKRKLCTKELIPIVSFFLQKRKCIACKNPISWMYPGLELLSAIVFVGTYLFVPYQSTGELIYWIALNRLLLLLFIYDLFTYELHVVVWSIALIVALLPQFFGIGDWKIAISGLLFFGGIFLLLYSGSAYYIRAIRKQKGEGMGEGDIFLGALLGTLLPYLFIYHHISISLLNIILLFLIFIIISCSVGIVFYFFVKRFSPPEKAQLPSSAMPFIPALIIGYRILLLFGNYFISSFF